MQTTDQAANEIADRISNKGMVATMIRCSVYSLQRIASMDSKAFILKPGQAMPTEQEVIEGLPGLARGMAVEVLRVNKIKNVTPEDLAEQMLALIG